MLVLDISDELPIVIEHEGETLVLTVRKDRRGHVKLGFKGPRSFA